MDNVLVGDIKMDLERRSLMFVLSPDFAPTLWQLLCVQREMYTHTPCRTHIFCALFPCVTYRHEHACHISPSHPLHSHVSSAVLAVPARSLRHLVPVCTFLAELFPIRKRGSSALSDERRGVRLHDRSHAFHSKRVRKRERERE